MLLRNLRKKQSQKLEKRVADSASVAWALGVCLWKIEKVFKPSNPLTTEEEEITKQDYQQWVCEFV